MLKKQRTYLLACILLIAGLLRFYQLASVPVSLYWDETAIAYNAYSVAQTGKDEYGKVFPVLFRSFDDYKMPGIVYLSAIPITIFGLGEWSARFVSAFLGTLTVATLFFLSYELSRQTKLKHVAGIARLPYLASLLLAIAPWHIQVSRGGFEANAGLFFVVAGFWALFRGFRQPVFFVISALLLSTSFYFYRSIHLFLPLLLVAFCIFYWPQIRGVKLKYLLASILLFAVISIPLVSVMFSDQGMTRFTQTSIFTTSQDELEKQHKKLTDAGNTLFARIVYNRRLIYPKLLARGYADFLNPDFLFFNTKLNDRGSIAGMGILYAWEAVALPVGLFFLYKKSRRLFLFVTFWILFALLSAALTTPTRNLLRSLNTVPILVLLSGFGFVAICQKLTKQKMIFALVLSCIVGFSLFHYLHIYYGEWQIKTSSAWADGYKEMVEAVHGLEPEYDVIVISGHYWKPYIYMLFYSQYSPATYQSSGSANGFGKYVFGGTGWGAGETELDKVDLKELVGGKKSLFVLSPPEFEAHRNSLATIDTIYNNSGDVVFIFAEQGQ